MIFRWVVWKNSRNLWNIVELIYKRRIVKTASISNLLKDTKYSINVFKVLFICFIWTTHFHYEANYYNNYKLYYKVSVNRFFQQQLKFWKDSTKNNFLVVHYELLPKNVTILLRFTANKYVILRSQFKKDNREKSWCGIRHYNIRPQKLDGEVTPHSPYSPDLDPLNFHLFRSSFNHDAALQIDLDELFHFQTTRFLQEKPPDRWEAIVNSRRIPD